MRVLFLGASRAVGILERFRAAAVRLHTTLDMVDLECYGAWHPVDVAELASCVAAPPFDDPGFEVFLTEYVGECGIDIVVPVVDRATLALARCRASVADAGALPVCSSPEVCETMADKRQADLLFRSLGLQTPPRGGFPLLAKPRFGEGSRGIVQLNDRVELEFWLERNRREDFVLQRSVSGPEFSVDGYVDRNARTLGLVSRRRIAVLGGEVSITRTERDEEALAAAGRLLEWGDWFGPVTVQVVRDREHAYVLDCNPRMGSGVTCSMEAGLAVPEWILRERLDLPLPEGALGWREGIGFSRSTRDHFFGPA